MSTYNKKIYERCLDMLTNKSSKYQSYYKDEPSQNNYSADPTSNLIFRSSSGYSDYGLKSGYSSSSSQMSRSNYGPNTSGYSID